MKITTIALAAIAAASTAAYAQQDRRPTLLILCDRACNWTLDADIKGHIAAGHSSKIKVESGEHILVADDGAYTTTTYITVKATGQTLHSFEFQPWHDQAEQAALEAQAEAAKKQAAAEQAVRDAKAAEEVKAAWTDPDTGLMWGRGMSGNRMIQTEAVKFCHNLDLLGYHDWRLPTNADLASIMPANGGPLKGGLDIHVRVWTANLPPISDNPLRLNPADDPIHPDKSKEPAYATCLRDTK